MVHPSAIKCEYHRQMWLYYFYQMMPNCMAEMQMYLQEYIRHKNISRDMEIEEDEDYFNIWLNTIKFPILSQNWFQKIKDKVALMPGYEGLKNLLSGKTGTTGSIRKIVKLKQWYVTFLNQSRHGFVWEAKLVAANLLSPLPSSVVSSFVASNCCKTTHYDISRSPTQ